MLGPPGRGTLDRVASIMARPDIRLGVHICVLRKSPVATCALRRPHAHYWRTFNTQYKRTQRWGSLPRVSSAAANIDYEFVPSGDPSRILTCVRSSHLCARLNRRHTWATPLNVDRPIISGRHPEGKAPGRATLPRAGTRCGWIRPDMSATIVWTVGGEHGCVDV